MSASDTEFKLATRRLHTANQRFEIFYDRLSGPGGAVIDDFLIIRPRVLVGQKVGGIVVLPVMQGCIGLMRGYRHQFDDYVWQAPSGFVEPDEDPARTALRELTEETALACADGDLMSLGTLMPDAGLIEARVALFVALDCAPHPGRAVAEPGAGRLTWFDPARAGRIADSDPNIGASRVVAITRYLAHRSRSR
jgi:ADP-ribose pyrophosphatase